MRFWAGAAAALVGVALYSHHTQTADLSQVSTECRQPLTVVGAFESAGGVVRKVTTEPALPEVVADTVVGTAGTLGTLTGAFITAAQGKPRAETVARYEAHEVSVRQASVASCQPCPTTGVQPANAPAGEGRAVAEAAARAAGFTGEDLAVAVAVAGAESGWRNVDNAGTNRNGTVDYGMWQINTVHADLLAAGDWRDPAANARMAYAVWERAGGSWTPWVTFNNGAYKRHLSSEPSSDLSIQQAATCAPGPSVVTAAVEAPAGSRTVDDLVAFGLELRARGFTVSENAALGDPPSSGSHSPTGWHYKHGGSGAIDVNSRPGTTRAEQRELAPVAEEAMRRGFGVIFMSNGHFGHLHIDVGDYRHVGDLSGLLASGSV